MQGNNARNWGKGLVLKQNTTAQIQKPKFLPLRKLVRRDRAEKRLRMCGLSWRAQPGNNNMPYKNGGVFKILRVASGFSRKSRVCLKTVD